MSHLAIGIDIGGTKTSIGIIDENGGILALETFLTPTESSPECVVCKIEQAYRKLRERLGRRTVLAAGIGIAGRVDAEEKSVIFAPNIGWRSVPLGLMIEESLGLPVVVGNDVAAITIGEWTFGAGRGVDNFVCIYVGTGIGGGIVSSGRFITGASNAAGEIGHIVVVSGGRRCTCGGRGCLEAYAGGWGIAERAREEVEKDPGAGKRLLELAGAPDRITAREVVTAYMGKDELATELISSTMEYLASGMVSVVHMLNPECLILGGGVIEGLKELVGWLEAMVKEKAIRPSTKHLRIVKAMLGGEAGVIGAAQMARVALEG
ncbi:MAG: ROK family protein [Candidatus Caldarchaeum sp.]